MSERKWGGGKWLDSSSKSPIKGFYQLLWAHTEIHSHNCCVSVQDSSLQDILLQRYGCDQCKENHSWFWPYMNMNGIERLPLFSFYWSSSWKCKHCERTHQILRSSLMNVHAHFVTHYVEYIVLYSIAQWCIKRRQASSRTGELWAYSTKGSWLPHKDEFAVAMQRRADSRSWLVLTVGLGMITRGQTEWDFQGLS